MQILTAAHQVFARQGYYEATIATIAKEAGVGKGTVYEYFESKEAIVMALMDLMMADYDEKAKRANEGKIEDPRELIDLLVESVVLPAHMGDSMAFLLDALAQSARGNRKLLRRLGAWFDELSEDLSAAVVRFQKEGKMNPDLRASHIVRTLLAGLDGMMLHLLMFDEPSGSIKIDQASMRQILEYTLLGKSTKKRRNHNVTNEKTKD